MPRTITIFLSSPPGDGLRAAREHFHEYVKPILVAGALDWEVIEGRREGEVRAGLASKIRRIRRRTGENVEAQDTEESVEDRLEDFRRGAQIKNWDGIQGDLILGRHTWKEYVRGMHEGWIGPLDPPKLSEPPLQDAADVFTSSSNATTSSPSQPLPTQSTNEPSSVPIRDESIQEPSNTESESLPRAEPLTQEPEKPPDKPPPKISPTPPYINPAGYTVSPLSPETPLAFSPSTVLPFPHLLGFLNTPTRIYRFLNRRQLADDTGRLVATLVLASDVRSFGSGRGFFTSADPDDTASPTAQTEVAEASPAWEQENVLLDEEAEWHKSAWSTNPEDALHRERPWQEKMVIDERIGTRMRAFDLSRQEEDERTKNAEVAISMEDNEKKGRIYSILEWLGVRKGKGVRGWEMGLTGKEDE